MEFPCRAASGTKRCFYQRSLVIYSWLPDDRHSIVYIPSHPRSQGASMNTIKTWQERTGNHNIRPGGVKHMIAEIAELRAALAARATPAQPVGSPHNICREIERGLREYIAKLEANAKPSPSSVGAAIRKLPLPEADYKFGTKGML